MLLHVLGQTDRKTAQTFHFPVPIEGEEVGDTVAETFAKFDERYLPYQNVTQPTDASDMFQKQGQPIDDFISSLQHQAVRCNFDNKRNHPLGDRITIGSHDAALCERVFRERDLTLAKIIETCRATEISKWHVPSLASLEGIEVAMAVNNQSRNHGKLACRRHKRQQQEKHPSEQRRNSQARGTKHRKSWCSKCGTTPQPQQHPAFGSTCYARGKFAHFASVCQRKQ